jgi:hypothetical protein
MRPPRTSLRSSLLGVVLLGGALVTGALAAGCGRTMSEEDCRKIADSLQQAWKEEAKKAAPAAGPAAEKAAGVVRSEEEKLVSEWTAECKKDLVGRRIDSTEFQCLLAAKTLAQISKCAEL